LLLVREAGGFVTDLDGGDADVLAKGQVAAGNDTMHRELLRSSRSRQRSRQRARRRAGGS
jgi:myo-inositol-1(or 4)-monophosphatase